MTARVNDMHLRMPRLSTHRAHCGQQQGGGHCQGEQRLMGVFPSPLPAWGVGHVDAQEQFPEVFAVLEPEKGGALD